MVQPDLFEGLCGTTYNCSLTKALETCMVQLHLILNGGILVELIHLGAKPNFYELSCVLRRKLYVVSGVEYIDIKMSHVVFNIFFQKVACRRIAGFCEVCPSLDKKQQVENSWDKKSRVALSRVSIFTHVDPYLTSLTLFFSYL